MPLPVTVKMKVGTVFFKGGFQKRHIMLVCAKIGVQIKQHVPGIHIGLKCLILKTHYNLHKVHHSCLLPRAKWHSQWISLAHGFSWFFADV